MTQPKIAVARQQPHWLTLSEAAHLLGVHPSTVRRWTNSGDLTCIRTPGGHRRFNERELDRFLERQTEAPQSDVPEGLKRSLVLQTRRELDSEDVTETRWHRAFDETERSERRASGRRLLGLAIQFTSRQTGRERILAQACEIGREYGRDAAERGLSLVDTTRAFLFFREALIRSARPGLSTQGQYDAQDVHIHRSLREFLDQVLFSALDAYERGLKRCLPTQEGSS